MRKISWLVLLALVVLGVFAGTALAGDEGFITDSVRLLTGM